MAKYAFVVAADREFLPATNALLNSLDYIGFDGHVHFIAFENFPLEYLQEAQKQFCYDIVLLPFDKDIYKLLPSKTDYMKRYRYQVASEVCDDYDAVCFIDTDMFFVQPIDLFFKIASNGIMLGCAKTGKVRYGGNPSYFVDGKDTLEKPFWNYKDICCCPIFFNKDFKKVFQDVFYGYTTMERFKASDLFAINSMIIKNKATDKLITMPCQSWVGTNETMLKPFTRVVEKEGMLISENGEVVYSVHGKWFSKGWHNGQIQHMERVIHRYLGDSKQCTSWYKHSLNSIMKWFVKMTLNHKIKLDSYSQHVKGEHMDFMKTFVT